MRRLLLLTLALFVIFIGITNAQVGKRKFNVVNNSVPVKRCGTVEHNAALEAADPSITLRKQQMEEYVQKWIAENPDAANSKIAVTIPVVFHIVWKTSAQNISDLRVQEQLDALNRDFAGLSTHSMGQFSSSLKVNTQIQFCLAQRTPAGAATTGIERIQTNTTSFSDSNDGVKSTSTGGANAWDVTKYFNIWVCNLSGGLLGYAQFPSSGINSTYGVVLLYSAVGTTGVQPPYNLGASATHEIGHCFNLYHIWGDDGTACNGSDLCNDTPNQAGEHYNVSPPGNGVLTDACSPNSPGVMYMNYMDYTDDIWMANFTPNQNSRMQALFGTSGALYSLTTSNGCTPVGGTLATLTTTTVTSITSSTASSGGNITNQGSAAVTARGVCWATSPNPVATGLHTTDGTGTGTFPSTISSLTAGTTYYVRAYATNSVGTAYGNELQFTTSVSQTLATLTTNAVTSIANTTATSGGNITNQGSGSVTARGVCWNTSQNPTISNSFTTDGTGTGTFSSSITGLTAGTTYYVRAYATNNSGTAYGNQLSFTTLGGASVCDSLMAASFTSGTCNLAMYYADSSPYDSGYVCGQNAWLDKEKAMLYSGSNGGTISDVYVMYGLKKGTSGSTSVKLYSSNAGVPGTLLGTSAAIAKSAIDTTNQGINFNNLYHFSTPITVGTDFFVSVVLPTGFNNTTNQLAIWSSAYACSSTLPLAYELWSDDTWNDFITVYSTNIDMAIFPVLCSIGTDVPAVHNLNSEISVYPNPSQDYVYCDLGKLSTNSVKLTVFNLLGKQVAVKGTYDNSGKYKLNFSSETNGIYFIQIDSPEGKFIRKVSINK